MKTGYQEVEETFQWISCHVIWLQPAIYFDNESGKGKGPLRLSYYWTKNASNLISFLRIPLIRETGQSDLRCCQSQLMFRYLCFCRQHWLFLPSYWFCRHSFVIAFYLYLPVGNEVDKKPHYIAEDNDWEKQGRLLSDHTCILATSINCSLQQKLRKKHWTWSLKE